MDYLPSKDQFMKDFFLPTSCVPVLLLYSLSYINLSFFLFLSFSLYTQIEFIYV